MAKKQSVDDSVSLFPFLSILACIIGILVLMITAITLGQIGRDEPAAKADAAQAQKVAEEMAQRIERYRRARQRIEDDRDFIANMRGKVEQQQVLVARYEALSKELADLEARIKTADEAARRAQGEARTNADELAKLTPPIADLEKQIKAHQELAAKLREELARRGAPPEEPGVLVQPSGSGFALNPTFVECAGGSVVLHDGPQPIRIPTGQLASDPQYLQLLQKVKETAKGTIIFLIRPDGVNTYNTARHIARTNYVTNGKLAIGGQGKLDLTRFGRKP